MVEPGAGPWGAGEHRAAEGGPSCTDSPSAACGCCLAWPPAPAKAVRSSALGAVHSDALSEPGQAPQSPDAPDAADLAAAEGAAAVYSALTLNVPAAPPPLAPADTKRRRKPEAPQLPLGALARFGVALNASSALVVTCVVASLLVTCAVASLSVTCVVASEAGLLCLLAAAPRILRARGQLGTQLHTCLLRLLSAALTHWWLAARWHRASHMRAD